jgi:hypothetical protein
MLIVRDWQVMVKTITAVTFGLLTASASPEP